MNRYQRCQIIYSIGSRPLRRHELFFDSEIVPKLFSKFTTKSLKGTGLGLFISKSIVEAHGGKIWAANNDRCDGNHKYSRNNNEDRGGLKESGNERRGATFNFTLPLNGGPYMVGPKDEDKR